jgi:hypothetical protein
MSTKAALHAACSGATPGKRSKRFRRAIYSRKRSGGNFNDPPEERFIA